MDFDEMTFEMKKEFEEFLQKKIETLSSELSRIKVIKEKAFSIKIADLDSLDKNTEDRRIGHRVIENVSRSTRGSVGWKYKVDEVLKEYGELPFGKLLERIIAASPEIDKKVATKSVGSTLSVNTGKDNSRYNKKIERVVFYYSLNDDYKENTKIGIAKSKQLF
jgi:hypothetical protein